MKRILLLSVIIILLIWQHVPAQGWQWVDTGYPYTIYDMSFPPGQSSIGFAVGTSSTSDGIILKTSDGGSAWVKISADTIPGLKSICFTSVDIGYVGGYQNCLMKSTDGGLTWIQLANQLRSPCINHIKFWDSNNGISVSNSSTVRVTTDAGATWHYAFGIKQTVEDICYADANTLYMVGADEKISKSTDGGGTWDVIYSGVPFSILLGVEFYNANYGIVGGESGKVLVTTNGGVDWDSSQAGVIGLISGVHIFDEQNAYVAGTPEQVFKTTDGGTSWVSDFNGANTISLYKILFTENLTGIICGSEGKFLINTDYAVPVELTGFTAAADGNDVHLNWTTKTEVNNYGFDILRSSDDKTWDKIAFIPGSGTTSQPVNYSFTDKQLMCGTYSYKLKQTDFNGSSKYSEAVHVIISAPIKYELEQNYPNPFNPSTTIKFTLPENAKNVEVSIYNILGQKVAELVNGNLTAGRYSYQWNAKSFASGVYIYELRTEKFVSIKKMTLSK